VGGRGGKGYSLYVTLFAVEFVETTARGGESSVGGWLDGAAAGAAELDEAAGARRVVLSRRSGIMCDDK